MMMETICRSLLIIKNFAEIAAAVTYIWFLIINVIFAF